MIIDEVAAKSAREAKVQKDWSKIAKEPVTVEQIGGAYYAFGSELAALRLFYHYKHVRDIAKADYSENLKTWFYRLEVE